MQHASGTRIDVSVLGRIEIRVDDRPIDLGTPRMRAIAAALALAEGRPVGFDALVERVWGAAPPATAVGTLQRYVAALRASLEPGRAPDQPPSLLVTTGTAYTLNVTSGGRDLDRFHDGLVRARQVLECVPDPLRPVAPVDRAADVAGVVELLDGVLQLWRGEPYADLGEHDGQVVAERARLQDLRSAALELRLVALLALGRHLEVLGDLETMTSLHPLHERWWALRAVALVRSGRQAQAIEVLGALRTMLADELGVDPSPPLNELYAAILRQDPSLPWVREAAPATSPTVVPVDSGDAARPRLIRPRWPLVGRDAERAALLELVADARSGHVRPTLITGEAGIGKTRLVQELALAAQAEGLAVALARCSEQTPALWPLRSALESLGPAVVAHCDLDLLLARPDDFATWREAVEVLRRATACGPTVLVLEDVQWADDATLRLLEHLVADCDLAGLSLVLTRRTKDGEDPRLSRLAAAVARADGLRLDLAPLPAAGARQLARSVDPDLTDVEAVCRRSGGNPFFVVELALSDGRLGGGLTDVVRTRLGTLDPAAQVALRVASTAGSTFDLALLAELLGADAEHTEAALEPSLRAGLVRGAGSTEYAFAHDVVREVLCDELSGSTLVRCRRVTERVRQVRQVRRHVEPVERPALVAAETASWPLVRELVDDAATALAACAS